MNTLTALLASTLLSVSLVSRLSLTLRLDSVYKPQLIRVVIRLERLAGALEFFNVNGLGTFLVPSP